MAQINPSKTPTQPFAIIFNVPVIKNIIAGILP